MMKNAETRTTSHAPRRSRPLNKALGWGASLLVIAGVCASFAWFNRPNPRRAAATPVWFEANSAKPREAAPPAVATPPISAEDKARALGQIARIDRVLRDYRRTYGEFPIGSNIEITRTLRGDNEKKIIFITPEEVTISARGEIVDAWNTPYFFHQLSGSQMEIMSAGPDRQMWTSDDLKVAAR